MNYNKSVWIKAAIVLGVIVLVVLGAVYNFYKKPSVEFRTYVAGATSFVVPVNWTVENNTYEYKGKTHPLFHITSPDRTNLPEYEGKDVHYLIQIAVDPDTRKIQSVGGFQQSGIEGGQSSWNTSIIGEPERVTLEYQIGQKVMESVRYITE